MLNEILNGLVDSMNASDAYPPNVARMSTDAGEIARMLYLIHRDLALISARIH